MTIELEQEFFRVFGIEPFCDLPCNKRGVECTDNTYCGNKYPKITAEMLLEMICIYARLEVFCFPVVPNDEETWTISLIKENIIEQLMYLGKYSDDKEIVKQQIQQLFKEEQ